MIANEHVTYRVMLTVPQGNIEMEILDVGSTDAAGRHAVWAAAHQGWGKVGQIRVDSVEELRPCLWFAMCENWATGTLNAGPLGDVDVCDRCRIKAETHKAHVDSEDCRCNEVFADAACSVHGVMAFLHSFETEREAKP